MKFRITFKDPDGVDYGTERAISSLSEGELISRKNFIKDCLEPWIKYDEYVTIEFDTDFGTATVVPNKE